MIPISMAVGQSFTVSTVPVPANGTVDPGTETWAVDVAGFVTLTPSADGTTCVVTAVAPGVANVSVKATSLGAPINGDDTVQVTVTVPKIPATALHVTTGPVN